MFDLEGELMDLHFMHKRKPLQKLSRSTSTWFNPFPNDKFHSSKLKQFADDNFNFDGNGVKFSEKVENAVGRGEIACYKEFLFFSQCFQKT